MDNIIPECKLCTPLGLEYTRKIALGAKGIKDACDRFEMGPEEVIEHWLNHKHPYKPIHTPFDSMNKLQLILESYLNEFILNVPPDIDTIQPLMKMITELRKVIQEKYELEKELKEKEVVVFSIDRIIEEISSELCDDCCEVLFKALENKQKVRGLIDG